MSASLNNKLGTFYLGRETSSDKPYLLESKNLTTHAVCVGMTGSGKTGLGIVLLEEAALDKIPAIIIDPKGDMGNLLLNFPKLSKEEFEPWVDAQDAEKNNMSIAEYAEVLSKRWRDGLKKSDEPLDRIQELRDSVEMVIYTPASRKGVPLSILHSFEAPENEDEAALRERVLTITSSLLALLGLNIDPIKSREHILIATIIEKAFKEGKSITIPSLIEAVQKPPFAKIGALDLETFFPTKERMELTITLNSLLASPSFQAWMEGPPLNVQKLLYNDQGKPKLSIISIAHLSDNERMFFVTLLLNEIVAWVRQQPGTSSLRALLYMDEIFGYFPPTAMPPSKLPMLTLLKQARAFGLGIVLATQNPVDLDYKGLANTGLWFIGKLQTERDKLRIIEGLTTNNQKDFSPKDFDQLMQKTGQRIFIVRSVYEKEPFLFQTRFSLSYLRGPLTLNEISKLMKGKYQADQEEDAFVTTISKPIFPPSVEEFFLKSGAQYEAFVGGFAKLHFVDSKNKIDTWKDLLLVASPNEQGSSVDWGRGKDLSFAINDLSKDAPTNGQFEQPPAGLLQEKNYKAFATSFSNWLYESETFPLYKCAELGSVSNVDETESQFRTRLDLLVREKRDEAIQKIKDRYNIKINALQEKIRKAEQKKSTQENQAFYQKIEAFTSMIATVIGAIVGKSMSRETVSSASTSIRRAGKIAKENEDVARAGENLSTLDQELAEAESELQGEIEKIQAPHDLQIETISLKPRKSDIRVEKISIIWQAKA